MSESDNLDFLDVPNPAGGAWRIARRLRPAGPMSGNVPGLVWLGGFASDMEGTKAKFLDEWARERGRAYLRFDYSGHGRSSGRFEDGCIGDWLEQSLFLFEGSTQGPQIVVGSSMGAWIALLLARRLAEKGESGRLAGLVLLAPAVDFTEALVFASLDAAARRELKEKGVFMRPSDYGPEPTPITRKLIEEGRAHLLLDHAAFGRNRPNADDVIDSKSAERALREKPDSTFSQRALGGEIRAHARVHILQGMRDADVPWRHALTIVEHLSADPTTLTFIADGDHRLSREEDLAQIAAAVETMSGPPPGEPPRDLFSYEDA